MPRVAQRRDIARLTGFSNRSPRVGHRPHLVSAIVIGADRGEQRGVGRAHFLAEFLARTHRKVRLTPVQDSKVSLYLERILIWALLSKSKDLPAKLGTKPVGSEQATDGESSPRKET